MPKYNVPATKPVWWTPLFCLDKNASLFWSVSVTLACFGHFSRNICSVQNFLILITESSIMVIRGMATDSAMEPYDGKLYMIMAMITRARLKSSIVYSNPIKLKRARRGENIYLWRREKWFFENLCSVLWWWFSLKHWRGTILFFLEPSFDFFVCLHLHVSNI